MSQIKHKTTKLFYKVASSSMENSLGKPKPHGGGEFHPNCQWVTQISNRALPTGLRLHD